MYIFFEKQIKGGFNEKNNNTFFSISEFFIC